MDQNTKRDRDQKMKRDKRSKDAKRLHTSKTETKSTNNLVSQKQPTSTKTQEPKPVTKPTMPSETGDDIDVTTDFNNLKRETDAIAAINKSFSKRQITSNWTRYETPLPPDNNDVVSRGADFESLLSAPISEGGHFKFKSEKMWSSNPSEYSSVFSLDLKLLARGLSCIPFYRQVDIPQDCFSVEELKQMENEAKQNTHLKFSSNDSPNSFYSALKSSLAGTEISPEKMSDKLKCPNLENVQELSKAVENVREVLSAVSLNSDTTNSPEHRAKVITTSPSVEANKTVATTCPEPFISNEIKSKSTSLSSHEARQPCGSKVTASENPSLHSKNQQVSSSIEEDELDFLLTLKEPKIDYKPPPKYTENFSSQPQMQPSKTDETSLDLGAVSLPKDETEDLESWLDSILD